MDAAGPQPKGIPSQRLHPVDYCPIADQLQDVIEDWLQPSGVAQRCDAQARTASPRNAG
jgi:hypothetical protein